jgi:hypothetical protein
MNRLDYFSRFFWENFYNEPFRLLSEIYRKRDIDKIREFYELEDILSINLDIICINVF